MIKFGKLRWKNLLSTGNSFTEVDLSLPGTTLIVGANGSGKSTLLEALSFSLYGKPFRRVNKSQMVNSINGGGTMCECEFSIGDRYYLVRRGIKPNLFEVFVDGNRVDSHGNSSDTQEWLEKYVLKMNYRACMQVVVLGSASYVPFMELPAEHRREVLEEVLDLRVIGKMASILKSMNEATAASKREAEAAVDAAAVRLRAAEQAAVAVAESDTDRVAKLEARKANVAAKMNAACEEGVALSSEKKRLEASIPEDVAADVAATSEVIGGLRSVVSETASKIAFFERTETCPVCDADMTPEHREMEIEKLKAVLRVKSAAVASREVELAGLREKASRRTEVVKSLEATRSRIKVLTATVNAMHGELNSIDAQIASKPTVSGELGDVPTLKRELSERREALAVVAAEVEVQRALASLLRDDGVKSIIVKQYVPVLNASINKYLAALDFYVQFELDENFDERILSRHRDEFSYASFSEGEKARINLAVLFTWRAVARSRNTASTNVVILDEVFDGSLDGAGAEDFVSMLKRLVGDTNAVIISHRTDQMTDKFDRVLRFEKVKNFSEVAK